MKKNLLSLIILSLLVVNIILTAVMLFSVLSTNKKTAAVVTDIASILQLELNDSVDGAGAVSIADTEVHAVAEQTISLEKEEGDTKDHFAVVSVSLSINMKHDDYASYGADLDNKEDLIKSEIISVVSSYTATEARLPEVQAKMCDEILERIQNLYGSTFIYKVTFSNIIVQ
ncbi:MAG: flagellar basal body-associated FliL family protein [Lachnospiraceae bacterium]|nr:flagellar basal body-associated FliL family protein [Lachnospiraceae bacterium]